MLKNVIYIDNICFTASKFNAGKHLFVAEYEYEIIDYVISMAVNREKLYDVDLVEILENEREYSSMALVIAKINDADLLSAFKKTSKIKTDSFPANELWYVICSPEIPVPDIGLPRSTLLKIAKKAVEVANEKVPPMPPPYLFANPPIDWNPCAATEFPISEQKMMEELEKQLENFTVSPAGKLYNKDTESELSSTHPFVLQLKKHGLLSAVWHAHKLEVLHQWGLTRLSSFYSLQENQIKLPVAPTGEAVFTEEITVEKLIKLNSHVSQYNRVDPKNGERRESIVYRLHSHQLVNSNFSVEKLNFFLENLLPDLHELYKDVLHLIDYYKSPERATIVKTAPPEYIKNGIASPLWFDNVVVPPQLNISDFEWLARCEKLFIETGMKSNGFAFGRILGYTVKLSAEYEFGEEDPDTEVWTDYLYMTRAEIIYVQRPDK